MKKCFLLSLITLATVFLLSSFTFIGKNPSDNPKTINTKLLQVPFGKNNTKISLFELRNITKDELQLKTGKKMNFFERLSFKKLQKKLRKDIADDGSIPKEKLKKLMSSYDDDEDKSFHLGGFLLGLLVPVIGVVIAYLINDDYKKRRVRWAWRGFLIFITFLATVLSTLAGAY